MAKLTWRADDDDVGGQHLFQGGSQRRSVVGAGGGRELRQGWAARSR
jgi:hypothetical protein